jgi:hypothetical protein
MGIRFQEFDDAVSKKKALNPKHVPALCVLAQLVSQAMRYNEAKNISCVWGNERKISTYEC